MQKIIALEAVLQQKLSAHFTGIGSLNFTPAGGGSINQTYRIGFDKRSVFCKLNSASRFPNLFQKEANGLKLIASKNVIKTPAVIDCFEHNDTQILLLEHIEKGERTEAFWKKFAEQLNALHNHTATLFGLEEDNYMGSVLQSNKEHWMWASFFEDERLRPMVKRCADKGLLSLSSLNSFDKIYDRLFPLFGDEPPSLLHGDLWSGNFLCNKAGEPVLIDPAVYYGHRSMDLAMTTLFGGFRQPFYEAYNHHFPLPKNHEGQWAVCNLYPLLIHLYLFGSSYLPQIERTLKHFE